MHRRSLTPLRQLADLAGIVPAYLDQTGTEQRETSDETRVALLAALGIDASTDAAARAALEAIDETERRHALAPVAVVPWREDRPTTVAVRLPSAAGGSWRLELIEENGERHHSEGTLRPAATARITLPVALPLGYHRHRLELRQNGKGGGGGHEWSGEQSLIVVPPRCVTPEEILDGKAFGVIANLYALRSARDWGVGDLTDLAQLLRWTGRVGGDFVGVNPLHALLDRGPDISPYSPVSRLFRNALYLDVEAVPELRDAPEVAARLDHPELRAELAVLREDGRVRYEQVMALKMPVLEQLHRVFTARANDPNDARARAYRAYVEANEPYLTEFATWMAIATGTGSRNSGLELPGLGTRDSGLGNGEDARVPNPESRVPAPLGPDWRTWPEPFRNPHSPEVVRFRQEHPEAIDLQRWIQFELDRQLAGAAEAARESGARIGLYQDLAIGTSPNGSDTWSFPGLFVDGVSIGAPPDPYSASGQNWGLPPIDPRALRRDGYRYFVRLLRNGFRHAGALRIDHVMGLFRLFWIPEGKSGRDGAYVRYPAEDLLGILALESVRHGALVVGEDLGTVPREVPPMLRKWGVLSSKVLYFERTPKGGFRAPGRYPAAALATANTHDMATLAGFWAARDIDLREETELIDAATAAREREEREREKERLVKRIRDWALGTSDWGMTAEELDRCLRSGGAELRGAVHRYLCDTPSVLVGLALDDLTGEPEAVNLPGVGPDRYPSWTRKMSMTIEEIEESPVVAASLRCEGRDSRGSGLGTRGPGEGA